MSTAEELRATENSRDVESDRVSKLKHELVSSIIGRLENVVETVPVAEYSSATQTVPGIAHLCFGGVESEALLFLLDELGVCASAASACASGAMEPSHVLRAMGVDSRWAKGALRLSLGHTTTHDDVRAAADAVVGSVQRLRA